MELNQVAWFFYWADIIPKFGVVAALLSILFLFIYAFIGYFVWEGFTESHKTHEEITRYWTEAGKEHAIKSADPIHISIPLTTSVILIITWLIFPAIAVLTPSSSTIYKMGASVIGEQIIQLEEVKELGGDVGELAKDTINMLRTHVQNATLDN